MSASAACSSFGAHSTVSLASLCRTKRKAARCTARPSSATRRQHADPVAVLAPAVAGVEREAAEPVEDRLALVDLHRQRVMRAVADDDVGAGVDRGVRDLGHVIEHFLVQAPVVGADHDVRLRAQARRRPPGSGARCSRSAQVRMIGGTPGRFMGGISRRVLCAGTWYAVWPRITATPGECSPASWLVGQYTEVRCRKPTRTPLRSTITGAYAAARFDAGAGVRDAQLLQARNRRADRLGSVVHVVGVAHGVEAGQLERFAGRRRRVEAFVAERALARRSVEAAFQVGEPHVRLLERRRRRARTARAGSVTFIRLMSPVSMRVVRTASSRSADISGDQAGRSRSLHS